MGSGRCRRYLFARKGRPRRPGARIAHRQSARHQYTPGQALALAFVFFFRHFFFWPRCPARRATTARARRWPGPRGDGGSSHQPGRARDGRSGPGPWLPRSVMGSGSRVRLRLPRVWGRQDARAKTAARDGGVTAGRAAPAVSAGRAWPVAEPGIFASKGQPAYDETSGISPMCAPWPRHTLMAEVPDVRVPLAKTTRCRAGSPYLALPKPEQASQAAHRRR
jgi:hypothetical protein